MKPDLVHCIDCNEVIAVRLGSLSNDLKNEYSCVTCFLLHNKVEYKE